MAQHECAECGESFASDDALDAHAWLQHQTTLEEVKAE